MERSSPLTPSVRYDAERTDGWLPRQRAPSQAWLDALDDTVRVQRTNLPGMYGHVDFDIVPERFTTDPFVKSMLPPRFVGRRADLLANRSAARRIRAYTMLGDTVADAYAALMPTFGGRRLIEMLVAACERGLEAVPDAPPELERFIGAMEQRPAWLDPKLSRQGSRSHRASMAFLFPMTVRGAFLTTFMNKYSGLPMALTGALSSTVAANRVKETASFFVTASLPGALERFGPGFRAAAMVRLMHSLVRYNILTRRRSHWDPAVYGIPIPQVDQMPAGMLPSLLAAFAAERGKRGFTRHERALVELNRHQSFLLGLPVDLLGDTPEDMLETLLVYGATLRDDYDDATNGALVRATMAAYLPNERTLPKRALNEIERSVSKVFFYIASQSTPERGRQMDLLPTPMDYVIAAAFNAIALPCVVAHRAAADVPVLNRIADRYLVSKLNDLLVNYGHPEYALRAEQAPSA